MCASFLVGTEASMDDQFKLAMARDGHDYA
jgi:hypothetical protein